jgi:hypothetical protein
LRPLPNTASELGNCRRELVISVQQVERRDSIELLTFRFTGALSSCEHLPGKGSDSPAHAHRRC